MGGCLDSLVSCWSCPGGLVSIGLVGADTPRLASLEGRLSSRFVQELSRRVLVFDGAMGTSIHKHDLDIQKDYCGCENCTDILAATRPDVIQGIHETFLAVGADCVETDSFGSNKLVL